MAKAALVAGNATARPKLKSHVVAVARDIPMGRVSSPELKFSDQGVRGGVGGGGGSGSRSTAVVRESVLATHHRELRGTLPLRGCVAVYCFGPVKSEDDPLDWMEVFFISPEKAARGTPAGASVGVFSEDIAVLGMGASLKKTKREIDIEVLGSGMAKVVLLL
ncbi:hypothetical protein MKZ38_008308 [Zalerion maritima]|uniref:Uncharacterized protein n=1 Tax=Zalerion maritima TaxID=339359 RepID=A0AAD5RGV6_9PEZI|nr:hypothetical protein MKZ38_008308 [Zalerion maritima]